MTVLGCPVRAPAVPLEREREGQQVRLEERERQKETEKERLTYRTWKGNLGASHPLEGFELALAGGGSTDRCRPVHHWVLPVQPLELCACVC